MTEEPGAGRFVEATLHPTETIGADNDAALAASSQEHAHKECFIGNLVNFPVRCDPTIRAAD
tara:strand:- start:265 stop:450 length:186 start_codon:yes stop_codon:yes gene_type:complete